jgi:hypothetical protein
MTRKPASNGSYTLVSNREPAKAKKRHQDFRRLCTATARASGHSAPPTHIDPRHARITRKSNRWGNSRGRTMAVGSAQRRAVTAQCVGALSDQDQQSRRRRRRASRNRSSQGERNSHRPPVIGHRCGLQTAASIVASWALMWASADGPDG